MNIGKKTIYTASRFYKDIFGTKVYKLSLNAGCTCPNRDGTKGTGGCIFCSESGSGDFTADGKLSVSKQITEAKALLANKLKNSKSVKYIAYFQNFTSTYGTPELLIEKYKEAVDAENIVGLSIATRPDCLNTKILEYLGKLSEHFFVSIELGFQTSSEKTGNLINRCYTDEDFTEAVSEIRKYSPQIHIAAHIIFGLPGETEQNMLDSVRFCVNSKIDGIKFTVLYVLRNTALEKMYKNQEFSCLSMEAYFELLYKALLLLPEKMVVHRLTGDGPKVLLLAPEWTADKKNVHNRMKQFFAEKNIIL